MMIDLGEPGPVSATRRRPALVPFGIDSGAETIFAFDCSAPEGEPGILIWVNEIGVRLDGFAAFLDFVTEMLQADVEERRRYLEPGAQRAAADPWGLAASRGPARSAFGAHAA
jgi:hypothetical protein